MLKVYLPVQLAEEEIVKVVKEIAESVKATSGNIGQAMKEVSSSLKGKADMKKVSELMKAEFANVVEKVEKVEEVAKNVEEDVKTVVKKTRSTKANLKTQE